MAAPQELWVLHQSVLRQLLVEELVDVGLQAVTQLQSSCRSTKGHFYLSFFFFALENPTKPSTGFKQLKITRKTKGATLWHAAV